MLWMFCSALLHFVGASALLFSYELCTFPSNLSPKTNQPRWECTGEGRGYVVCGLLCLLLEPCVLPVFITWLKPVWRTPFLGKWLSEWMQLQGFCFPHGGDPVHPTSGLPRHVYLSDGGHIDNLAILEPLRRRSRIILCPHCGFTNTHTVNNLRH